MWVKVKTVWQRGDSAPDQAEIAITRKGTLRFVFGGPWLPLPNIFGEDRRAKFNRHFDAGGYGFTLLYAEHQNDNSIATYVSIDTLPSGQDDEGPIGAAVPLILIVGGIAAIVGAVLIIMILSKLEAVMKLPLAWIAAGIVFVSIPFGRKVLSKAGAG